jgi:hypothetical protein
MDGSMHHIFKCMKCERVTGQCRCPGPKTVRWVETCYKCELEKKDDLPDRKSTKSRGSKNRK